MKHIKKKFFHAKRIEEDAMRVVEKANVDLEALKRFKENNYDGMSAMLITSDNELLKTFKYTHNNFTKFLPEPNPVTIYFDLAQKSFRELEGKRKELLNFSLAPKDIDRFKNLFFDYYSTSSSCVLFLFISLETFINTLIPDDTIYKDDKGKEHDLMSIQKNITFEDKIKKILPEIYDNCFHVQYGHKFDYLKKLKKFRDEITHTKAYKIDSGVPTFEWTKKLRPEVLTLNYETRKEVLQQRIQDKSCRDEQ